MALNLMPVKIIYVWKTHYPQPPTHHPLEQTKPGPLNYAIEKLEINILKILMKDAWCHIMQKFKEAYFMYATSNLLSLFRINSSQ